jgi:ubiquitin carboxyl-terminal hydrolase 9/24
MPQQIAEIIYKRDIFLKKIIEDSGSCEDSLRLLRFLIWENPDVTSVVLNEIITLVNSIKTKQIPKLMDSFFFSFQCIIHMIFVPIWMYSMLY